MNDFKSNLRNARKAAGLTQTELAEKIGISRQVVSNLERGYTNSFSSDLLQALSDALDVPAEQLLGVTDKSGSDVHSYKMDDESLMYSSRMRQMMQDKGIDYDEFIRRTGFSKDRLDALVFQNTRPTLEELVKTAAALGTSTDYLLGVSDIKEIPDQDEMLLHTINDQERILLTNFRELDEDHQYIVMGELKKNLIEQRKEDLPEVEVAK